MTEAVNELAAMRKRSRAQWLFRALLEDEKNRTLSVVELPTRWLHEHDKAVVSSFEG